MEQIKDIILKTICACFKYCINNVIEKKKITNKLNSTVDFLTADQTNQDRFNERLKNVIDDASIKTLCSSLDTKNGFTIIQSIEKFLHSELYNFDFDYNYIEKFISDFITIMLDYLKNEQPELYEQHITQQVYEKQKEINTKISSIFKDLNDLKNSLNELFYVETSYEIEANLRKNTKPSIDLNFFEPENDKLYKYIEDSISKKQNMYIISSTYDEAIFTILYELSKFKNKVYIVKSEDNWIKLKKKRITDTILIPDFIANTIDPISNCINIFIYSEESLCISNNKFHILRRRKSTVENRLSHFTNDRREAMNIVNGTLGVFTPLMEKIYIGKKNNKYDISESDTVAVFTGMLIQKWVDDEGDKTVIEYLSCMEYDKFISIIEKYMIGDNPIFIKIQKVALFLTLERATSLTQ